MAAPGAGSLLCGEKQLVQCPAQLCCFPRREPAPREQEGVKSGFVGTSPFLWCLDRSPGLGMRQPFLCATCTVLVQRPAGREERLLPLLKASEGAGAVEGFQGGFPPRLPAGPLLPGTNQSNAARTWEPPQPDASPHTRRAWSARWALQEGQDLTEPPAARKQSLPLGWKGAGTSKAKNTLLPGLPSTTTCFRRVTERPLCNQTLSFYLPWRNRLALRAGKRYFPVSNKAV